MRNALLATMTVALLVGCATATSSERQALIDEPVHCQFAEQILEQLQSARPSSLEQARSVLQMVTPVGLISGAISGSTSDRAKVAMGSMSLEIDDKIDAINEACLGPAWSDPDRVESKQNPKAQLQRQN